MKKLNFNLVNLEEVPKEAKGSLSDAEVAGVQFCNTVGRGMGNVKANMHQLFRKIKDQVEAMIREDKGIVLLDDSDFNFFRSQFFKAELPVERNLNVVVTEIIKVIDRVEKVEDKGGKNKNT